MGARDSVAGCRRSWVQRDRRWGLWGPRAEDRSEPIRHWVSEDRRSRAARWGAWAPKNRQLGGPGSWAPPTWIDGRGERRDQRSTPRPARARPTIAAARPATKTSAPSPWPAAVCLAAPEKRPAPARPTA